MGKLTGQVSNGVLEGGEADFPWVRALNGCTNSMFRKFHPADPPPR